MKQNYPTLSKAPIKVAILEILFETPDEITIDRLKAVHELLKHKYPIHIIQQEAQVKLGIDVPNPTLKTKASGHIFLAESRSHDILLTTSTFNFKQHGSYTNWNDFKEKALEAWGICKPYLKITKYKRLSLRYINHIDFKDLDKVFEGGLLFNTFIMREGGVINKPISGFTLRYTHIHEEDNIQVNFMEEQLPGSLPDVIPFVIDIDVLHNKDYMEKELDIERQFDKLRLFKNTYFFDNLTEFSLKTIS